jgi:hypothetical protein
MQIFSTCANFQQIADCLDNKRLQKQKIEIFQILKCLSLGEKAVGWKNHPAVLMVKGFEPFFIEYGLTIADKCIAKGWKDTIKPRLEDFKSIFNNPVTPPWYWGDERFHGSHRANLIFKNYEHYKQFNWPEIKDYKASIKPQYFWPTKQHFA